MLKMRIYKIKKLMIAIFCLFPVSVFGGDILIISAHPDYPPVSWEENGTIIGASIELASIIFSELEVPIEIRSVGPWPRVQMYAEEGIIDIIANAYINRERQMYMDYSIPFMIDPVSVFVLKENTFPFNRWEDLIGKNGVTVRGESYGSDFDQFMEQNLSVYRVTDTIQNFLLLDRKRVDYAIIGLYPGLAYATIAEYDEKIEVLPVHITEENFYMTFSKRSEFTYLLPEVNRIIERLRADGDIDRLIKKYLDYYIESKSKERP